jgi:hypothetical protein
MPYTVISRALVNYEEKYSDTDNGRSFALNEFGRRISYKG